ncbi:hypothetical protein SAMN05660293_02675 [Dyadobacter psychrophilus]|uniref:Uncharacterized protein n=1 Tax=Dyadobacter psychrophilus TaxID=651661 RepID=A0A1T5EPW0_9BACT|nr:hypothetical protein SAMN05660293_02675 [Dyadobacter psychrophilus]
MEQASLLPDQNLSYLYDWTTTYLIEYEPDQSVTYNRFYYRRNDAI